MTVTELMNKLIELTADGKGDLQVYFDDDLGHVNVDIVQVTDHYMTLDRDSCTEIVLLTY